jgi:hypothetical protein
MAETFGEADVILRVRLDELQKELDISERMVDQSTMRIADSQKRVAQEVQALNTEIRDTGTASEESGRSLIGTALDAFLTWRLLGGAVRGVGIGLKAIPAVAIAASAALIALATGGILLMGRLADEALRVVKNIGEIVQAARDLDGSTDSVRHFADQLERIPLLGGAMSKFFQVFSGDAQVAQEAMTSLVAKIEDGTVKVGFFGKAMNGLMNFSGTAVILRMLGLDTDIVGQINDINREIEKMQRSLDLRSSLANANAGVIQQSGGMRRGIENEAATTGLDGEDLIREEQRQRFDELQRMYDEAESTVNRNVAAEMAAIRAKYDAEEIDIHERNKLLSEASDIQSATIEQLARDRTAAEERINELTQRRIELLEEEKARAEAATSNQQLRGREDLQAGVEADAARLGGDDFAAQRIELLRAGDRAINDAIQQGRQGELALLNEFYQQRLELIDQAEEKQRQREEEIERKRQERMLDANEDLRSKIREERLRQAGDLVEAQQEAIMRRFQQQIDAMEADGNQAGADLARQLRDLELEGAGRQQGVRRAQEFQQVSFSRSAPGGAAEDKVQRDQLVVLKDIAKNTKQSSRSPEPARAG